MDNPMKTRISGHILPLVIALLVGLIGVAIFFVFGLFSGRGEIGLIATCILFLMNCALIVGWHAASWWYVGILVNIPVWCLLYFWSGAGLLNQYVVALTLMLIFSHIGSFVGLWFSGIVKRMNKN